MAVRASIKFLNAGQVKQAIDNHMDKVAVKKAHETGADMAEEATRLMAADYDLARPYDRRRYPGSRRAATALSYKVEGTGSGLPIEVSYRVLGGDTVVKRIIILNWGRSGNYPIRPSGAWPLAGRKRASHFVRFKRGSSQGVLAWPGVVTDEVSTTSTEGTEFLERGRDAAVARNFG